MIVENIENKYYLQLAGIIYNFIYKYKIINQKRIHETKNFCNSFFLVVNPHIFVPPDQKICPYFFQLYSNSIPPDEYKTYKTYMEKRWIKNIKRK